MWLCITSTDSPSYSPPDHHNRCAEHWYQHGCQLTTLLSHLGVYLFKEASPYHSVLSLTSGVTFYDLSNPLNLLLSATVWRHHCSPHHTQPQAFRGGHLTAIIHNKIIWFLLVWFTEREVGISLCFREFWVCTCACLSNICRWKQFVDVYI